MTVPLLLRSARRTVAPTRTRAALVALAGAASLAVCGQRALAQVVFTTDFENGLPAQFVAPAAAIEGAQGYAGLGPAGRRFGGAFLRYAAPTLAPTTLTLTGLPPHTFVDVEFLLAIIDSWDGVERMEVRIDGQLLFSHVWDRQYGTSSYTPPVGAMLSSGVELGFGSGAYYFTDLAYDLGLEPMLRGIPHTASTLTVEWSVNAVAGVYASNWQGGLDESWAIDAVRVRTGNAAATSFGTGCGSPPLMIAPAFHSWPRLGETLRTNVDRVPAGVAFMALGFSSVSSGGVPLPASLAAIGMPGCDLLIDAVDLAQPCAAIGAYIAQHAILVPDVAALVGMHAFLQAWAPAPGVNAAGIVVSNGIALTVGG